MCRRRFYTDRMQPGGTHRWNDITSASILTSTVLLLCAVISGVSSELFDSLKVYLSNKSRLQPIIGLWHQLTFVCVCMCVSDYRSNTFLFAHSGLCSIVECVNADSCGREALYLCEVCMCSLNKADMRNHIMGSLHRYNYIVSNAVQAAV